MLPLCDRTKTMPKQGFQSAALPTTAGEDRRNRVSGYRRGRAYLKRKITVVALVRDLFLMSLGVFSAAFGLKSIRFYWMILLINAPFVFLGYRVAGMSFAIKTACAIVALAIVTAWIDFPEVTHDKLLTAVFGGFFLGAGIGLSVRGGSVIDGTEVLAIQISRRLGLTIGDVITMLNVMVFSVAAYLLSIDVALYSMITYLAASRTVDFVVEGIEEYLGITIVSARHDEIKRMIMDKLGRGVTVYHGKRGYVKSGVVDTEIVYTVITRLEMSRLYSELAKIDPNAFVVTTSVKDTRGGLIKKRRFKH
jgi:uncharacterized membrane-anchored protein YitT (DUF2179 family)